MKNLLKVIMMAGMVVSCANVMAMDENKTTLTWDDVVKKLSKEERKLLKERDAALKEENANIFDVVQDIGGKVFIQWIFSNILGDMATGIGTQVNKDTLSEITQMGINLGSAVMINLSSIALVKPSNKERSWSQFIAKVTDPKNLITFGTTVGILNLLKNNKRNIENNKK